MRGSVSDFEPVANKLVFRNLLRSWDGAPKGACHQSDEAGVRAAAINSCRIVRRSERSRRIE